LLKDEARFKNAALRKQEFEEKIERKRARKKKKGEEIEGEKARESKGDDEMKTGEVSEDGCREGSGRHVGEPGARPAEGRSRCI